MSSWVHPTKLTIISEGDRLGIYHPYGENNSVKMRFGTARIERDPNGNRAVFFNDGDFDIRIESTRQVFRLKVEDKQDARRYG